MARCVNRKHGLEDDLGRTGHRMTENVMDLECLQNSYLQRKRRMKPLVLGKLVQGKNSSKGCQLWLSMMGSVCGGCCCCCKKLL